jgi:hypothetical protein
MDKAEMERIWNGAILNCSTVNKFKLEKQNVYSCTMKLYKKVLVDEFTETGYFKNEKIARSTLEMKLNAIRAQKGYSWGKHVEYENLSWTFHHK